MKINTNIFLKYYVIIIVTLLCLGVLIYGSYFYRIQKKEIQTEEYNELRAIAELKADQISQWHKERLSEAIFFSVGQLYKQFAKDIIEGKKDKEGLLRSSLLKIMSNNRYENIFLLNERGQVLFSVLPDSGLIDSTTISHSKKVFSTKSILVHDLYYCKLHKRAQYEVLAPITDNGKVISALVFMIDPARYLYPLIQKWPLLSRTGEALIIRREGSDILYLSQLKHGDNTKLQFHLSLSQGNKSDVSALLSQADFFEGPDYGGKMTLETLIVVPDTPWYLIVKEDAKEVYAEFYKNIILVAVIIFLTIFLIIAIISWINHRRQRDLYRKLLNKSTALYLTQEEFRATLYSINDGVITTDRDGLVRHMNPMAELLTGWSEVDAINQKIEEVFQIIDENNHEKVESPVDKVLQKGKIVEPANHTVLLSRDGRQIPIRDSGAPIKNKEENLIGVVLIFSDQSEMRLRRKLLEMRLNLYEFSLHHELKEILTRMLDEIGSFTQSPIGFLHFVKEDQETIQSQVWSTSTKKEFCHIERENPHYNLSEAGVWADCIRSGKPVVHNDYQNLPNKKGLPDGHAPVIRELVVPVYRDQKIVAVFGVGNKPTNYTDLDIETVSFLADVGWRLVEQKMKEERLVQSEERFAHLFERAPLGYQSLNENGNFIEINRTWTETLGYDREEVIGKWFGDFLAPDYVEKFRERFPVFKSQGKVSAEFEMVHKNGQHRLIAFEGQIGYKNDGSFEKNHCILQDVTEKRLMEEKLRANEEKMQSIFRVAPSGIGVINDKIFVEVNPRFCEMSGYSKEELIGKKVEKLYVDQDDFGSVWKEICLQIIQKGIGIMETCWFRKDGTTINVIVSMTRIDSADSSKGYTFNVLDITERKVAEIAIKEHERRLSSMISNLPGFVYRCRTDENCTMLYISNKCTNVTGYQPEDFINNGKISFSDIIVKEYQLKMQKEWKKIIAEKEVFEQEYQIVRADGEIRWVFERGYGVYNTDNEILFMEGYIEDITDRKNAEMELKRKMAELEKFNKIMVGRENKMIELKQEINGLLVRLNLPMKYKFPQFLEDSRIQE